MDAQGLIGWAPASYLVPVNENDLQEEAEENEQLIEQERGKLPACHASLVSPVMLMHYKNVFSFSILCYFAEEKQQ